MGTLTNTMIDEAREAAGFEMPTDAQLEVIAQMKRHTVDLLEALVLEEAGVCDGDGYWHGGDPIAMLAGKLDDLAQRRHEPTDEGGDIHPSAEPRTWYDRQRCNDGAR